MGNNSRGNYLRKTERESVCVFAYACVCWVAEDGCTAIVEEGLV